MNEKKITRKKRRSKSPKKFQHHTEKKCVPFWISLSWHHPHFRRFKSHFHDRFRVREGKSRKDECRIVLLTIWMSTKKLLKILSLKSEGENPHVWPGKLWFCFQQGFFWWFQPWFFDKIDRSTEYQDILNFYLKYACIIEFVMQFNVYFSAEICEKSHLK